MEGKLSLNVYPAKVVKTASYQNAFANVPCECCDTIQPVFQVTARYGDTVLLQAFVPATAVEGAVGQAIQLAEILGQRIDAAELAWEEQAELADSGIDPR